jgi:O-antigen/teichoic acid export membrane protein
LVIGRLLGAKQAGIYAIGLTILYFLRTVFGILFAPFSIKFNHYIGLGDSEGLKLYLMNIIVNLTPFIVIPIITLTIFTKPIILSWVGIGYSESIEITQCLIFLYVFSFIFFPMSFLLNALERLKELYLINTLLPLLYWILIAVTFSEIGLLSFAISKVIVFAVSSVIYYSMMIKYLNISLIESVKKIISPIVPSTIYTIVISNFLVEFMPVEKSNINLLITMTFMGLALISSFIFMYIVSKDFKRSICKAYNLIGVNRQHNVDKSVT